MGGILVGSEEFCHFIFCFIVWLSKGNKNAAEVLVMWELGYLDPQEESTSVTHFPSLKKNRTVTPWCTPQ